jgi:hypothetical protein
VTAAPPKPHEPRVLKERVPLRHWLLWWTILGAAVVVFYVLLTPIWLGLRAAAWAADLRSRGARKRRQAGTDPRTDRG